MDFVGFLDNEGMVKTLRQAQTMSHRDLHRAHQGNLYLREIKALMQKFWARVQWEWLEAHTDRKGWLYERHNKCDHVAGVVAEDADLPQARFVEWDWDFILVDDQGKRVEGDVRRAVRQRVSNQAGEKGQGGGRPPLPPHLPPDHIYCGVRRTSLSCPYAPSATPTGFSPQTLASAP